MEGSILAAVAKAGNGFVYRLRSLQQLQSAPKVPSRVKAFDFLVKPESEGFPVEKRAIFELLLAGIGSALPVVLEWRGGEW